MTRKTLLWTLLVVLVLVPGGAIYHASLRVPTGPAEGDSVAGAVTRPPSDQQTLRFGTFNIHSGKGRDGQRDLQRVAKCLEGLDFVALNEVHGPGLWQHSDQAQQLGRQLGMAWLFAPNSRRWYFHETGNGLLTALPVSFWQRIPLSRRRDHSHRNLVLAALQHRRRTIHVLLSHINRRDPDRSEQLRAVIELYLALAAPAVLMGDLNSDADDPLLRRLLATPGVTDPVGEILATRSPGGEEPRRIDWIITRGLNCVDAGMQDDGASDHPVIWVELEL